MTKKVTVNWKDSKSIK